MAAKPRFRIRASALAVIAAAIAFLSSASASLAATGSVGEVGCREAAQRRDR